MALNRRLCVPQPRATEGVQGWAPSGFNSYSSVTPTLHPFVGLSFPTCTEWVSSAQPK